MNLRSYNTFKIDAKSNDFIEITKEEQLQSIIPTTDHLLILGGGSNILFTEDPKEKIIYINTKGIKVLEESSNEIFLEVAAGENWHDFVLWCVDHNYGGIENLSLIPGNVGTCPIQNIGAYGVEVKDVITQVNFFSIETGKKQSLSNENCHFGYRNSIFKNELKGKTIISSVIFKLSKGKHHLNRNYGIINQRLDELFPNLPVDIKKISQAVISIRSEKLPNPKEIGNAGSFFKNPVITEKAFSELQKKHPDIPNYPALNGVKVPAGWLIDQLGLKGFQYGGAAVHKKQALVLINHSGQAKGTDVYKLAKEIQGKVKEFYGINLEIEVNIYPNSFSF
ncbi:MAG: UDP-N-acetylmuramate dehydrogenase [Flavobacteriaceae bacterium]